ncbi:hypothetical protein BC829DRAFT_299263 [Chytridium lagenaria]|nr:hypothetical protein BC829DRAFT_299263 [Chytridium lagenaria]
MSWGCCCRQLRMDICSKRKIISPCRSRGYFRRNSPCPLHAHLNPSRSYHRSHRNLDAADAEISYSHMSMSDFTRLHNSVQALSGHLFALDTALSDMGRSLMDDEQLRERFLTPLEEPLRSLQGGCLSMLDETRREVGGGGEGGETEACNGAVRKAVAQFEEKQFEVLFDLFEMRFGVVSEGDAEERAGRLGWDSLMQVNFLILGIHEFVDELINTHSHLHSLDPKKTFHFHFRHFVPKTIYDFFKRKPAPDMESARTTNLKSDDDNPTSPSAAADILVKSVSTVPAIKKKRGFEFRTAVMLPLTKFWLSPASIYAMKCATAVLLLNLIVYAQPQFSLTWGLQGSVITFLVAIAPSLGQTYLGFPMQLIATFIGALWAFAALSAFGASGAIGIIAFGLILVTPMMYIFLFNKAMPVLGLLAMLSFSNSVVLSYINRNRPFDAPVVRLYKNLANVTMGLTFALIFTLAIYPNLARRSLRALLSSTITLINGYYADLTCNLMSNTLSKRSSPILDLNDMKMEDLPQDTIARLRDTHNAIALKLAACEPLMIFSSVEPRVEGAFQGKSYRSVIEGLKRVLDRLGNARAAAGAKRFPPKMKWLFTDPKLSKARAELYQTIRLLLFIFSSTFIAKQRLPHDLPNAFAARKRLVESFMELAAKASDGHTAQYRSEAWVRFYSYALAIRGISLEMDALAIPIKELFGELPDITFGSGDPGSYGVEGEDAEDDEMARVAEMNAAYTSLLAVRGVNEGLLEEAMEDDAVRNEEVVYDFERKVT